MRGRERPLKSCRLTICGSTRITGGRTKPSAAVWTSSVECNGLSLYLDGHFGRREKSVTVGQFATLVAPRRFRIGMAHYRLLVMILARLTVSLSASPSKGLVSCGATDTGGQGVPPASNEWPARQGSNL